MVLSRSMYKKQRGRRLLTALAAASIMGGTFLVSSAVLAKPGAAAFELDADVAGQQATITDHAGVGLPDDWDRIANGTSNANANATSFVPEVTSTGSANNTSIFTGGGSKDQQPISAWGWKDASGGLPDKDNLLHAMAARYTNSGNEYLFFGADRFDNSGDSQIGFWFFRSSVSTNGTGGFDGVHTAKTATARGDILVLSDFTNGGSQPTIRIFEYVGSGGTDGSLNLIGGNATDIRDCALVPTDDFCASVNPADGALVPGGGTTGPWLFTNKSSQHTFGHGEFYEGGINLNFFNIQNECFSSVLAETRSSQSVTATLKDFVLGGFQQCSATLSTAPSPGAGGTVTPGTQVTDTATVTGQGGANPPNPTGSVTFYICGPIASGTCAAGTQVGDVAVGLSNTNPATATSAAFDTTGKTPGRYCFRATWPGDTNYPGALTHSGTGDSECFNIAKINTSTVTTPVDGSGTATSTISLGGSIYDKAVVTGTAAGGDPTGKVKFFICGPIASGTCDGTINVGTQVGTPLTGEDLVSDGVAGTYTSNVTSEAVTPTAVGRYCFRAEYGGDTVYNGSSDSATTECFTVGKLPTTTVTTPVNISGTPTGSITLGGSIYDKAVVTGSSAGGDPTGTVKFFACGPIASGTCDGTINVGTQVGTPAAGEDLVSDGVAGTYTSSVTSDAFTPGSVGRYCFRAEYGGDANYTGSSDSATTECFTVSDTSTTSSTQTWLPNDNATVSSANGAKIKGTLAFTLYSGTTCSGTPLRSAESFTLTGANASESRSTTNGTVSVTASGSVSWGVVFTPDAGTGVSGSNTCEITTLTITN